MRSGDVLLGLYSLDVLASAVVAVLLHGRRIDSRHLSRFFALAAVALSTWILWSYRIINVAAETSLGASLVEVIGIWIALGALRELVLETTKIRQRWAVDALAVAAALLLGMSKVSHQLFGSHLPVFFWIKNGTAAVVLIGAVVSALVGVFELSRSESRGRSRPMAVVTAAALAVASVADIWFVGARVAMEAPYVGQAYPVAGATFLLCAVATAGLVRTESYRHADEGISRIDPEHLLTVREREVVELILAGRDNRTIASVLSISPATVKNHVYHIYQKLGIANRGELFSRVIS